MKMDRISSIGGLLDASFPRTRELRFVLRPISLDTRFGGYNGTQVDLFIVQTIPYRYFLRRSRRTRGPDDQISELRALRITVGDNLLGLRKLIDAPKQVRGLQTGPPVLIFSRDLRSLRPF